MTAVPRVSVVIASKDEPQLAETLCALHRHIDENNAECIVVDASRKRLDFIRLQHTWVHWIDFVGPLGIPITIAHQRNAGVNASQAKVIAFCDSGGIPHEDWLSELVAPLREGRADATCGPIYSLDSPLMRQINELPDGAPVRVTVTANMAVVRSVFDAVNGFDERFSSGEDTDFGWRLRDSNFRVVCAARAKMSMHWGDLDREVLRARRYGQGTALLFVTHPGRIGEQFMMWPDLVAYPAWVLGLPITFALALVSWWIPVGWCCLLVFPVVRAMQSGVPLTVLRSKWARTMSFFKGLVSAFFDLGVPVVLLGPSVDTDPRLLSRAQLLGIGVATERIEVGRWLAPRLVWRRARGARIAELRDSGFLGEGGSLRRAIAGLRAVRCFGIRVVVWDRGSDVAERYADGLIVDSPSRKEELVARYRLDRSRVVTIPGGSLIGAESPRVGEVASWREVAASVRSLYESVLGSDDQLTGLSLG